MGVAEAILLAVAIYAALGAIFGVAFILSGAARIDHAALGAPWSFRLLILPGAASLWPLLLVKWLRAARAAPHGDARP